MKDIAKVLIIEDNEEIVEAVSIALQIRWPRVKIVSTENGEEGIDLVEKESPDVVILDLGLPDVSGFEVLKRIRLFSTVPVVILTVRGEEADIVKGLELGADEYIVKPFRQLELLARVKALIRRESAMEEDSSIVCGPLRLDPSVRTVYWDEKRINLTRSESIILQQLMRNAGNAVTHANLAEKLWGDDYPDAAAGLKVHIRRLREKIEPDPTRPKLILTRPGVGYFLAKPD